MTTLPRSVCWQSGLLTLFISLQNNDVIVEMSGDTLRYPEIPWDTLRYPSFNGSIIFIRVSFPVFPCRGDVPHQHLDSNDQQPSKFYSIYSSSLNITDDNWWNPDDGSPTNLQYIPKISKSFQKYVKIPNDSKNIQWCSMAVSWTSLAAMIIGRTRLTVTARHASTTTQGRWEVSHLQGEPSKMLSSRRPGSSVEFTLCLYE